MKKPGETVDVERALSTNVSAIALSRRARGVLRAIAALGHIGKLSDDPFVVDERLARLAKLSDVELLRRARKASPPVTHDALVKRARGCGTVTAMEISRALGLPTAPAKGRVQCPQCGHVFGGAKL